MFHGAADDQRRSCFIDKDAVHFIHDGITEFPLNKILHFKLHVVAKVIKAELIVGAVSDVAAIGLFTFNIIHAVYNHPHAQTQSAVYGPHPFGVPFGQIVIDRYQVDPPAFQGVEVERQGRCKGFALARFHFSDLSLMKDDPSDKLNVKMSHAQGSDRGFSHGGKSLGKDVVQGFSLVKPLLELSCF